MQPEYREITASGPVTVLPTDGIIDIAQTIPATLIINVDPATLPIGKKITIKDVNGVAATYPMTITPSSGTFDGQATFVLQYAYQAITFYSNGTKIRGQA